MSLTAILVGEHRVIESALAALEEAVEKLGRGVSVRTGFFLDAAEFLRAFADGCHHRKEEGVLLPAMMGHGFPMMTGPLAVILAEHEKVRAHTRVMRDAAEALDRGDRAAAARVEAAARECVALLRRHMAKEEQALFPMAESAITAAKHAGIAGELARAVRERQAAHDRAAAAAAALQREMSN